MDSIELVKATSGNYGEKCQVRVTTGDTYSGIFHGYGESPRENPLMLRLGITKAEADRIGVPYLSEIGIRYEVITSISF